MPRITENEWKYQLYNEDCFETFKRIPDGSIDLVLVDPPYGTTACKWDSVIPLERMWRELARVIKVDGTICFCCNQPFTSRLISTNFDWFRYCWYWHKTKPSNFPNANCMPLRDVEDIAIFSSAAPNPRAIVKPKYYPQGVISISKVRIRNAKLGTVNNGENDGSLNGTYTQTLTNYPRQLLKFASESKTVHPTQKPVPLMKYLIKTYSNEGDTILDFALGSGTTGVACGNLNRKFIGCDSDKEHGYFQIAQQRIKAAYQK